ncbi:MAG: periplasmic heavy metal sensor [Caldimicrobium sp.]
MKERVLKVLGLGVLVGGLTFGSIVSDSGAKAWGQGPGVHGYQGYLAAQHTNVPSADVYQKFYQDTYNLRQKIWQTREELRNLYLQPNPDWKAIAEKRAALAQLQTELQKKAQEYGIPFAHGRGMGMRGMPMGGPMDGMGCKCMF